MAHPGFHPTRVTLLARLRSGTDQTAWLEFESTYRSFIFCLILRTGLRREDAEDISQTVLTKVWQKIEAFEYNRNQGKFHNWLAAVTRNTVKDFFRSRKNFITGCNSVEYHERHIAIEEHVLPGIENLAREEWVLHITNLAWDNIKDDIHETKRQVFKLVAAEKSNRDIADQLGLAEPSVRVYKAEVFERMRAEIKRLTQEPC